MSAAACGTAPVAGVGADDFTGGSTGVGAADLATAGTAVGAA